MSDELLNKVRTYIDKRKDVKTISSELGIEEYEVYGLVQILINRGLLYNIVDGKIIKLDKPIKNDDVYKINHTLEHLRLLLISDTHLGSKYDRLDILRYLYQKAEDSKVDYILHSGDMTDGLSGRPQQIHELRETSYTGQRDYVIDKYPRSDIKTYFIAGNHDLWWIKQCGSDICKDISNNRDDLIYLGSDCEDLKIGKLKIRLYHGKGGSAYAKSYKLQKYLDGIQADELPDILQAGHTHQEFYYKQGNTHCFQTSCLQDLTPFERSMGFPNEKSCWWLDVDFDDKGNIHSVSPKLESFTKKLYRK